MLLLHSPLHSHFPLNTPPSHAQVTAGAADFARNQGRPGPIPFLLSVLLFLLDGQRAGTASLRFRSGHQPSVEALEDPCGAYHGFSSGPPEVQLSPTALSRRFQWTPKLSKQGTTYHLHVVAPACTYCKTFNSSSFKHKQQRGVIWIRTNRSKNLHFTKELLHHWHFTPKSFPLEDVALQSGTLGCKTQRHYTEQRHRAPVPPWIAKLTQTSATLDCKTHENAIDYAEQRDPAVQKPSLSLFPLPSSQCRDNFDMLGYLPISGFLGI